MGMPPSGTVTFLFTDIEGSTRLWSEMPEPMRSAHARHDEILRQATAAHHGHLLRTAGDSFAIAYPTALDALTAALDAQRAIQKEISIDGRMLGVRMGLHSGAAQLLSNGEYDGYTTLATAQRVMSAASGGQILCSQATVELCAQSMPAAVSMLDVGQHHLKGLTTNLHLYQVIAPDLPRDFAPIRSSDNVANNLPIQLTSFFGREKQLAEAAALLTDTRLLTFTGPGGAGKTRMSLQLAEAHLAVFRDGIWFVELAPLTDPDFISAAIAEALKLREVPGTPMIETLADYLRGKEVLLVLDNCEHLVDACARLSGRLLHECPRLKIVASSRESLGVDGETVYRVPSLPVEDAVNLFMERARKAEAHFRVTEGDMPFVRQICARLDGMPLGIELAAARIRVFSPEQIAQKLDDRFQLLTGGSRTALPRQQTLRAMIDWSYQLLTPGEQRALRRLAVFSGGWTFEAAQTVLGGAEALENLDGLVTKSLVDMIASEGAARYSLLETIRQYVAEKLADTDDAHETRTRHLDYYRGLLQRNNAALDQLATAAQVDAGRAERAVLGWLHAIEKEYDNVRAALAWAIQSDMGAVGELLEALNIYWSMRDRNSEARKWCKTIAEHPRAGETLRCMALGMLAYSNMLIGEMKDAMTTGEQGLAIARRINNKLLLSRGLSTMAMARLFAGEPMDAREAAQEAEAVAREAQLPDALAQALLTQGNLVLFTGGDPQVARQYMQQSMAAATGRGWLIWGTALGGLSRGRLAARLDNLEEARREFSRAAELALRLGDRRSSATCYSELAHALRHAGNLEEAALLYQKVLPIWHDLGHRAAMAHELECLGYIASAQGNRKRAATLLGAAEALRRQTGSSPTAVEQEEYARELAVLRERWNATELEEAWRQGTAFAAESTIEWALEAPGPGADLTLPPENPRSHSVDPSARK